jgi:hypothetical protein
VVAKVLDGRLIKKKIVIVNFVNIFCGVVKLISTQLIDVYFG